MPCFSYCKSGTSRSLRFAFPLVGVLKIASRNHSLPFTVSLALQTVCIFSFVFTMNFASSQVFLPAPLASDMAMNKKNDAAKASSVHKKHSSKKAKKHQVPRRPRRALTAYNLFTTFMRQKIVQGTHLDGVAATPEQVYQISLQHKHKAKRAHRKTEGMVSFQTLSRMIAHAWKVLPQDQRDVFEAQALVEKRERQAQMLALQVPSTPRQEGVAEQTTGAPSHQTTSNLADLLNMTKSIQQEMERCASPESADFSSSSSQDTMESDEGDDAQFDEAFFSTLVKDLADDEEEDGGHQDDSGANDFLSSSFTSDDAAPQVDFWDAFTSSAVEDNSAEMSSAFLALQDFEVEAL